MDKIKELENEIAILKIRLAQMEEHYARFTRIIYDINNKIDYKFRIDETYKYLTFEQYIEAHKEKE